MNNRKNQNPQRNEQGSSSNSSLQILEGLQAASIEQKSTENLLSSSPEQNIELPKIIHFIWAGGKKTMPKESMKVVAEWAKQNPGFEIWLWVDAKTSGKKDENQNSALQQITAEYYQQFQSIDIKLQLGGNQSQGENYSANIIVKDIEEEKVVAPAIRYEIDRARPNYGASSDMLRYRILNKFGGAYFDSDIMPARDDGNKLIKPFSLENSKLFEQSLMQHHLFLLEHETQRPNNEISKNDLETFNVSSDARVGNDAFICTRNNPVMKAISDDVMQNYDNSNKLVAKTGIAKDPRVNLLITMTYGASNRRFTIFMTGPERIRYVLNKELILKEGGSRSQLSVYEEKKSDLPESQNRLIQTQEDKSISPAKNASSENGMLGDLFGEEEQSSDSPEQRQTKEQFLSYLRPLRCSDYCLTDPLPNTLNWLKVIINKQDDESHAIECIRNAIIFEANQFNILRLDDHIADLKALLEKINPDIEYKSSDIATKVIDIIKALHENSTISLEKIQCAQLCSFYTEIIQFFKEYPCLQTVTFLSDRMPFVIPHACALEFIAEIERCGLKEFDDNVLQEIVLKIEKGLDFILGIENLGTQEHNFEIKMNSDQFKCCQEVFEKYKQIIDEIGKNKQEFPMTHDILAQKNITQRLDLLKAQMDNKYSLLKKEYEKERAKKLTGQNFGEPVEAMQRLKPGH